MARKQCSAKTQIANMLSPKVQNRLASYRTRRFPALPCVAVQNSLKWSALAVRYGLVGLFFGVSGWRVDFFSGLYGAPWPPTVQVYSFCAWPPIVFKHRFQYSSYLSLEISNIFSPNHVSASHVFKYRPSNLEKLSRNSCKMPGFDLRQRLDRRRRERS